ncbi:glycosyltransferase [Empedobacter falsenii]
MKLAGVVIVYHPNFDEAAQNIKNYIEDLDLLIIWDNTPSVNQKEQFYSLLSTYSHKILYLSEQDNKGIAYALNRAFETAQGKGFNYILTMDQDSIWKKFKGYKEGVSNHLENDIAIYAPLIISLSNNMVIRCNNTNFVITSGSIYNITLFNKIGHFREEYLIDEVDNEYCIKAVKKGYKIKLLTNSFLYQTFGSPESSKGLAKYTAHYSAFRTYHQIRNRMWVWREYSDQLSYKYILRTLLLSGLRRLLLIVLYEKQKKQKLLALVNGFKDGFFKKII